MTSSTITASDTSCSTARNHHHRIAHFVLVHRSVELLLLRRISQLLPWLSTSHAVRLKSLYSAVSTMPPFIEIVITTSPNTSFVESRGLSYSIVFDRPKFTVSILPIKHSHILTHPARWHATSCSSSRPFISSAHATEYHRGQLQFPVNRLPANSGTRYRLCLLLSPSADFLGACPSLNCHCANTSFTTHATHGYSSPLPLLSFVRCFFRCLHSPS